MPRRTFNAPAFLLAQSWDGATDVAGWWVSEKLDGVRAWWDGARFLTREGNLLFAPEWFTAGLPAVPLDGELWIGRGQFERTAGSVRRKSAGDQWGMVKYLVFDAPNAAGPFEERQQALGRLIDEARCQFARVVKQSLCQGNAELRNELARIVAAGGEGLMLRQAGSLYEAGRSNTLLKVKQFDDAEAVVVHHLPGTGRHAGRMGALVVRLADGKELTLGTGFTCQQRDNPPAIGSVICFRHSGFTDSGKPRSASFLKAAEPKQEDEEWRDIPGYEGCYQASSFGRVRSLQRKRVSSTRLMKPGVHRDGYDKFNLCRNGVNRTWHVHTLIALAFLGPRPKGALIDHKDLDHKNNRADNLEYKSGSESNRNIRRPGQSPTYGGSRYVYRHARGYAHLHLFDHP